MRIFRSPVVRPSSAASRIHGFSLLELLIVLAIAAAMFALVPPLFSGAIQSAEHKATAYELAAALKQVRSQAISTQEERVLTLDLEEKQYIGGTNPRPKALPQDLEFALDTARSEQTTEFIGSIRFFPDGSATGGRITLSNATQRKYFVDVDWLTGRVQIND